MSPASTAFVVGIGASAGGVEALEHFFAGIPPSPNMSFIVVTHLGSGRTSHMPDIIGRHTALPVHSAQDDMLVENNQIYVLAADADISLSQGRIKVAATAGARKGRRPIDQFFTSLAKDYGARAVGVVLSGSDSDGTLGLKAIKEYGGITMAQTSNGNGPAYEEMSGSAISAGIIDFALPAEEMGARLHQLDADFDLPFGPMAEDEDSGAVAPEMENIKSEIYELLL
ncbi:chemotaxis protein CheB, partial [Achromobacter spanius]